MSAPRDTVLTPPLTPLGVDDVTRSPHVKKREKGSSSYRRRGKDSWQLTVRAGAGKRLTKTVTASSEAEARRLGGGGYRQSSIT